MLTEELLPHDASLEEKEIDRGGCLKPFVNAKQMISRKLSAFSSSVVRHQHPVCVYTSLLFFFVGLLSSDPVLPGYWGVILGTLGAVLGFPRYYVHTVDRPVLRVTIFTGMLFYMLTALIFATLDETQATELGVFFGPAGLLTGFVSGGVFVALIGRCIYAPPVAENAYENDDPDQEFNGPYGDLQAVVLCCLGLSAVIMTGAFLLGISDLSPLDDALILGVAASVGVSATMIVPYVLLHALVKCTTPLLDRLEARRIAREVAEEKNAEPVVEVTNGDLHAVELDGGRVLPNGTLVVVTNGEKQKSPCSQIFSWMKSKSVKNAPAYLDRAPMPNREAIWRADI